jgi:hypothetical protein
MALPFFALVIFLCQKNFNYIAKNASIFHLKSSSNDKGLATFQLPLMRDPPSPELTYYKQLVGEMESF